MPAGLLLRPLMIAMLAITGVVTLTVLEALDRFDAVGSARMRSRFSVVLNELHAALEAHLSLGLSMRARSGVHETLAAHAARHPEILLIEMFDENGTVLFSTDPSFVGDLVSAGWYRAWRRSRDGAWYLRDEISDTIGRTLENSFGQPIGGVGLTFGRESLGDAYAAAALRLGIVAAAAVTVALLVATVGVAALVGPTRQHLAAMTGRTEAMFETGGAVAVSEPPAHADPNRGDPATAAQLGGGRRRIDRFLAACMRGLAAIQAARQTVHDLDRNS